MKYNIEEIKSIIPHRYPFLLIDQIDDIYDQTIIGKKAVTIRGCVLGICNPGKISA